jgi:hypothetical protein
VGADHEWMLGANAAGAGVEMDGSRLIWEIENWAVPVPKEGKAQRQNPDDDTADGADMVASMRYALLSAWRPGAFAEEYGVVSDDRSRTYDYRKRRQREHPHMKDLISDAPRRAPRIQGVRPRVRST